MPLHFVNPNYHVILIHYPLGVFVLGVFLELFSLLWRKGSIRVAAVWMILLGAFLSLPAVTSGIYALWDVSHNQGITGERYDLLRQHVWFQSIASLLAVMCAVTGLGASDHWRAKLRLPLLLGLVISCGLMVLGSWNGGETIYRNGTSVRIINEAGEIQPAKEQTFDDNYDKFVHYYIGGELQVHIITAGFAMSAIVGALGLSIRRLSTHRAEVLQLMTESKTVTAGSAGNQPQRSVDDLAVMRSINPEAEVEADFAHVPAGRWWLLAALISLGTAALGYWILSEHDFAKAAGWEAFTDTLDLEKAKKFLINRHMAHLILGSTMVVLALLMGLIARFAPRRPLLLTFFASLLVLVVSAQVWMGIALTFDNEGPLYQFKKHHASESAPLSSINAPETAPATTPVTVPALPDVTTPATLPTVPQLPSTLLPGPPDTSPSTPATLPIVPIPLPATLPTTVPILPDSVPSTLPTLPNIFPTTLPATAPSVPDKVPTTLPTISDVTPATLPSTGDKVPTTLPSLPDTLPTTLPATLPSSGDKVPATPPASSENLPPALQL